MIMKQSRGAACACSGEIEAVEDREGRRILFRIFGEIDHHGSGRLREEMDSRIAAFHPRTVEIELSGVSFMDSAGLGLLLGRYSRVSEYGGELILVNPTEGICKILRLAGADKLLTTVFRKEEAMEKEVTV